MLKDLLVQALTEAVEAAVASGALPADLAPKVGVEKPRDASHGDYATNLAMTLSKAAKMPPFKVAEAIKAGLKTGGIIQAISLAGPGFINMRLSEAWLRDNLRAIVAEGTKYGHSQVGAGQKVLLEFVSANPTGPLHVGHGRWAAIGSSLARLMATAGFTVHQEFYINDAGNQMLNLGRSVEARLRQAEGEESPVPEDGYHGAYIKDVAAAAKAKLGVGVLAEPEDVRVAKLTDFARDYLLGVQQATLTALGTHFDHFFSEKTLHDGGQVLAGIEALKASGHLYEQDGAWWLRSTDCGDDKDRVVVRDNGQPTYLAADIAYHKDKLDRGFTRLVNILGADHHGYVARLQAVVQALGGTPDTLAVVIGQMVNLFRDGEPIRMSKRTGEMVTLQEVIDEVGADAARYFLLMRSADTTLDFDLGLAVRESADNPVFYVQYAHARINSILRMAANEYPGLAIDAAGLAAAPLTHLTEPDERQLLLKLATYPDEIASAALSMEPYKLARYAQELATSFHQFYASCRVLTDDQALTHARLALIVGTKTVLRNVLEDVLGVSAPERMESLAKASDLDVS